MGWDPELVAIQAAREQAMGGRSLREIEVDELRELTGRSARVGEPPVHTVEDRRIDGAVVPIDFRIYRPNDQTGSPALIWIHGGGWTMGGLHTADGTARSLCNAAECVVISVNHRHAPEHPYPAAFDDVYAATAWIAAQADDLGIDRSRIAIGGESSGANLAAATCLAARERMGPQLVLQLLVIPALEYEMERPSAKADGDLGLSVADCRALWDYYLAGGNESDPFAVPIKAASVANLPPAYVMTGEHDPMRDGGEAYAARLESEGGNAAVKRYQGVGHGFLGFPIAKGAEAIADAAGALRSAFAAARPASLHRGR